MNSWRSWRNCDCEDFERIHSRLRHDFLMYDIDVKTRSHMCQDRCICMPWHTSLEVERVGRKGLGGEGWVERVGWRGLKKGWVEARVFLSRTTTLIDREHHTYCRHRAWPIPLAIHNISQGVPYTFTTHGWFFSIIIRQFWLIGSPRKG